MGFRFRKSIKIAPGIRWNIGSKSSSISFGPRGAKVTVGTRGTRVSAGIPGTGVSVSQQLAASQQTEQTFVSSVRPVRGRYGCPSCATTVDAQDGTCPECAFDLSSLPSSAAKRTWSALFYVLAFLVIFFGTLAFFNR